MVREIRCRECRRPTFTDEARDGLCEPCQKNVARNTHGCCDGGGQVHHSSGVLGFVTLCRDRECMARREHAWAVECGEIAEQPAPAVRARYSGDEARAQNALRPRTGNVQVAPCR